MTLAEVLMFGDDVRVCGKRVGIGESGGWDVWLVCRLPVGHAGPCEDQGGQPVPRTEVLPAGIKHDATKARWDLVPWAGMTEVVHVLTHGAAKYAPDNWRKVPDHRRRYLSAALRHMTAWAMGEIRDTESGRPHLAHAVCCLLFLIEREGEQP